MKIQYNGSSKILKRLVELVNRSQNVALRQDNTDKNTLYWTGLDGVEITVNIPSGAVEVDTELSETSTNPVENQAITKELAQKADKSAIPTVGDGVLSVQRNGKSVGTFSANAAKDTAVNIPVPEKVSELENDAGYGTYTKPATGIPKSDLASGVQASLGKADTALQKHQDISGKQDKSTAVTHSANTAAGSATKPVYVDANGVATAISHSINSDVPANAKFTDTTYNDATQSTHGLMPAADKKKLDGMDLTKYMPLSGGVMTGDIDMQTNKKDILVGTQPASAYGTFTPVSSGQITTDKTFADILPTMRSYIGTYNYKTESIDQWYDLISVRHRNGYGDGRSWGMSIFAPLFGGDLRWNLNTNKDVWQGERTLLDSVNYTRYALAKDGTAVAAAKLSTARKINTIAFDGTADIVIPRSTKYMNTSSGTNGQTGYVKVATFTVKSQYANMPTVVRYRNRNAMPVELIFRFKNQSRVDPELEFILQVVELTGYGYKEAYLYKSDTSTWDLIIAKSEAYDSVQILDCQQADGVSVAFENTHVSTVPSTAIKATVYERAMVTSTVANATTWNGLINDVDTYNSSDTCILVKKDNRIQHRYAGELDVNSAKTLVDSGWIATTRNTSFTATSTVKCRKYGQLVEVRGEVTFNSTYGSPTVCTLPAGYRPATVVQACGITPSGKQYMIKADTSGVISFGSDSGSTFVKGTTYRVDLTYLLG